MTRLVFSAICLLGGCALTSSASAKTLEVGPGKPFAKPSAAIAAAQNGDTIRIAPGQYFDCAIVPENDLTIEGTGPGVILTDKVCSGKGLLVIDGNDVTVRNLTLQRARVPDSNGAGIRAEGGNLTVENVRFLNDEDGILSADNPKATIRVIDSEFVDNGKCNPGCAHAIYVNAVALLHIEHSRFFDTHEGHDIKSRALRTEVIGNDIEDGPEGSASYLIDIPNGGSLIVENNTMEKGIHASNQANTIMIGEEGVTQPSDELIFRNNTFTNDQNRPTTFVHNITATPAQLSGNTLKGQVRPLEGDGSAH